MLTRRMTALAALAAGASFFIQPLPICAATSASNPQRLDPYKNFKFRLKWDGQYVAAASSSGEIIEHRSGGDPSTAHKSPGRDKYEPITLERGLTQDAAFHQWAGSVESGKEPPDGARKDLELEVYDDAGVLRVTYKISRCWTSNYKTLPPLKSAPSAIAIEQLTLSCETVELEPPRHSK